MLTTFDKCLVAILMAAANAIRSRYGIDFGLDNQMAYDIVNGVTAGMIWLIPNKVV
jgi:hypothetical protein